MKKIILSAIVFVGAMTLNAQEEAPKLSVSRNRRCCTERTNSSQMAREPPDS